MVDPSGATDTALGKAVIVLRAFRADDRGVPLAEIVRRTGLSKSTLHRLLGQLVGAGLIDRVGDRYLLSRLVFELGMRATVERDLLDVAGPFLEELRASVHETVHLGVREGAEVFYVAELAGHRQAVAPSRPGGRLGLHCTAVGKALAHASPDVLETVLRQGLDRRTPRTIIAPGLLVRQLEQVRATGLAFEHEESCTGLVCVGSPVLSEDGSAVAAVSVAGPVHRFVPKVHGDRVRATAQAIATSLAPRAESPERR